MSETRTIAPVGVGVSRQADRPAYPSKSRLAFELDCSESTVDALVSRGILPKPLRLSTGCVRWSWAEVEAALTSLKSGSQEDPFLAGARNVTQIQESRRAASTRRS